MFRCVLTDSKLLRNIIDAIAVLVDEGTFKATKEGLTLSEMDPGKVGMIQINIPASIFDEYECEPETAFRLDITELKKTIGRAKPTDQITLSLKENENRFLIQLLGKVKRSFTLAPRDVGEMRSKAPQIPFKASIRLISESLRDAVKDVELFSENIILAADKKEFKISGAGNLGEVEVVFKSDDEETILSYELEEDARASYAINYLRDMVKISGAAQTVIARYATNMPLELEFELLDAGEGAYIKYLLAPRRES